MKRPFCVIGGAFLFAAFLASFVSVGVQAILAIACTLAFFFALVFLKNTPRASCCTVFLCAAAAFSIFAVKDHLIYRPVTKLDQSTVSVAGTITQITPRDGQRYSYTLSVDPDKTNLNLPPFSMILYTNCSLDAECYDQIHATVDCFLPTDSETFDSIRYYKSDNIFMLGYLNEDTSVTVITNQNKPLLFYLSQWNESLGNTVQQQMPSDVSGILNSLILGNRDGIDFSLKQDYTKSGIVHLLAISGMHVSMLAGFLYFLFSKLRINRRIAVVIQITVVTGFILLSGIQISAVRAGGMILLLLLGKLFYRRPDPLNSLCCAGFFIVFFNVYAIMDIGFLMSFCATLGILLCFCPISGWIIQRLKITGAISVKIVEMIALSFSANLFLIPIYVFVFGTFSIISVITNIFVNLIVSAELILGFLLIALFALSVPEWLTQPLRLAETVLIRLQNHLAEFFGNLPFSTIGLKSDAVIVWLILSILIVIAVFLYRKQKNLFRQAFLFIATLFVLIHSVFLFFTADQIRLCVVGDGKTANIILIDHFNATVISTRDDNYIDERTYSFLEQNGIHRINNLILTYSDFKLYEDTRNLTQSLPVENILYHRENIICRSVLSEESKRIGAIEDNSDLTANNATLNFSYAGSDLEIRITCNDISILITDSVDQMKIAPYDICLLVGSAYDGLTELSCDHLILLQKQYQPVLCDRFYQEAYRQSTEYIITKQGELISQEKEGFFCLS